MATLDLENGISGQILKEAAFIAVMGLTGSGKSTFIQNATGLPEEDIGIGHTYESCTQAPKMFSLVHSSQQIVLIDTPGFDDSMRTDADVLQQLADFLVLTYKDYNIRLSGIIYLHDITKNRLNHGGKTNLVLFRRLCGTDPLRNVILATSRWGVLSSTALEIAARFEKDLENTPEYWGDMIAEGSTMMRFEKTKQSALEIIQKLLDKNSKVTLDIQKEMGDRHLKLVETAAGGTLNQELLAKHLELERKIEEQARDRAEAEKRHDTEMAEFQKAQEARTQKILRQNQAQIAILHENDADRTREFKMEMRKMKRMQQEHEQEEVQHLDLDITRLKSKLDSEKEDKEKIEKEIKEKERKKVVKEKWLAVLGAGMTTAIGAGISVINPLAIPVAVDGLIKMLNALFTKNPPAAEPTNINLDVGAS